jgi:hypothetical protein
MGVDSSNDLRGLITGSWFNRDAKGLARKLNDGGTVKGVVPCELPREDSRDTG